jgi:hypothetical protein
MTFIPTTGIITSGTFTVAVDGSYVETVIDIAQDAPLTARTVVLGGIIALPASPGANKFRVTLPVPELLAIQPIRKEVGSTFTLTVFGKDLSSASSIDFTPATGISVNNPPSVSGDGTTATVSTVISANTPTGIKIVTVSTPGGTTSGVASAANTFTVTTDAGAAYAPLLSQAVGVLVSSSTTTASQSATYSPVLSQVVGVSVLSAPSPTQQNTGYGPITSLPVGIVVGSTITGITPNTIEPGASATITIYGSGLDQVNAVQIQPSTGFTIGTPTIAADGLSTTVTVTADAGISVGTKTIIVSTASGAIKPASSGAMLLLTGPKPVINTLQVGVGSPMATVGTTVTLTINGLHLQNATQVQFLPSNGIEISTPPTYSADGTAAYVTVVISSSATNGEHVVIISTPYGTTDSSPAVDKSNTFTVASTAPPPTGWNMPIPGDDKPVLARKTEGPAPAQESDSRLNLSNVLFLATLARVRDERREAATYDTVSSEQQFSWRSDYDLRAVTGADSNRYYLSSGYRGPPAA